MEKIKSILNPGHKKDDEVLYGEGNPTQTISPSGTQQTDTGPRAATGDAAADTSVRGQESAVHGNTDSQRQDHGHFKHDTTSRTTNQTGHAPTDDSATVASIKSGVVGGAGRHSQLTEPAATTPLPQQAEGQLPPVPVTGGKFMDDTSSTQRTFPLSGGSITQPVGTTAAGQQSSSASEPTAAERAAPENTAGHKHGREGLAGAAGAATAAIVSSFDSHEHGGLGHQYRGDPCGPESDGREAGFTAIRGPHTTNAANLLDPAVAGARNATAGGASNSAADSGISHRGDNTNTSNQSPATAGAAHHYGRDAAVAGGGSGAAATAAAQAWRHHEQEEPGDGTSGTRGATVAQSTSAGRAGDPGLTYSGTSPYSSKALDPRVDSGQMQRTSARSGATFSTTGRDPTTHGRTAGAAGNVLDPRVQPDPAAQKKEAEPQHHHYGRDAAVVGGVGAAGVGAYEAHTSDKAGDASSTDRISHAAATGTGPASNTIGPHDKNWKNILDPRVQPDPYAMKGGAERKKHQAEEEAVAGGVGAAGVGAYEAEKHHRESERGSVIPTTQGSTAASPSRPQDQHHYSRDAAIAGTGVAGLAAYEATKHHRQDDDAADPLFSSVHPAIMAGYDDQRAAPTGHHTALRQQPHADTGSHSGDHHYGRDTAVAGGIVAAGIGAYEADKNLQGDRLETERGVPVGQQIALGQEFREDTAAQTREHHYGRDAAVAGGVGAAGVGAYEADKHHRDQKLKTDHAGEAERHERDPHYGRDAAIVGGAGAAGVGAYETDKHLDNKLEEERAKEAEKREKEHQKQLAKEEKKERKAEEKEERKERKAEEKEHHKLLEKQRKAEEKEERRERKLEEKEERRERKAEEKEEKKEKKGGLLGFLHRKDEPAAAADDDTGKLPYHHSPHDRREEEAAVGTAAAGTTVAGATTAGHTTAGHMDAGHTAEGATTAHPTAAETTDTTPTTAGTYTGSTAGAAPAAGAGGLAEHDLEHNGNTEHHHHHHPRVSAETGRNRLHKDPPPDHPAAHPHAQTAEAGNGTLAGTSDNF